MQTYQPSLLKHFSQMLAQREDELQAALSVVEHDLSQLEHEVTDFKDLAGEETTSQLDARQAERLHEALRQVAAAQQRLQAGHFGECLDCGEPIDLRRLTALPETRYCAACQAVRESAQQRRNTL